jgi:hypothetical protein
MCGSRVENPVEVRRRRPPTIRRVAAAACTKKESGDEDLLTNLWRLYSKRRAGAEEPSAKHVLRVRIGKNNNAAAAACEKSTMTHTGNTTQVPPPKFAEQ